MYSRATLSVVMVEKRTGLKSKSNMPVTAGGRFPSLRELEARFAKVTASVYACFTIATCAIEQPPNGVAGGILNKVTASVTSCAVRTRKVDAAAVWMPKAKKSFAKRSMTAGVQQTVMSMTMLRRRYACNIPRRRIGSVEGHIAKLGTEQKTQAVSFACSDTNHPAS